MVSTILVGLRLTVECTYFKLFDIGPKREPLSIDIELVAVMMRNSWGVLKLSTMPFRHVVGLNPM